MTVLDRSPGTSAGTADETPAQHHPHRWRMQRAGFVNVWHYYDETFDLSGGRLVLRGTNGSGKSRALELLLPFLLDADRRRMDATGSGRVRLEDLMRAGGPESGNRLGYVWLELARERDLTDVADRSPDDHGAGRSGDDGREVLTVGALVRFSTSTTEARAWYFTTPLRVGHELALLGEDRQPLSREALTELVGADRVTASPEQHRERVRGSVFGLTGDVGAERYEGLLQLLHTLRSPDVGNRIDEGRLPTILSEALPPLAEAELQRAGEQLDGLEETRQAQGRLEADAAAVEAFVAVYARYASGVLHAAASTTQEAVEALAAAESTAESRRAEHERLLVGRGRAEEQVRELVGLEEELVATLAGLRDSAAYRSAQQIDERERRVVALERLARSEVRQAATARSAERGAAEDAAGRAADVVEAARAAGGRLDGAREQLRAAGLGTGALPGAVTAHVQGAAAQAATVRTVLEGDPETVTRPGAPGLAVEPDDVPAAAVAARAAGRAAADRQGVAAARRGDATGVERQERQAEDAGRRAEEADEEARAAEAAAEAEVRERDDAAVALAQAWRGWTQAGATTSALGEVDWSTTDAHDVLLDVETLTGAGQDEDEDLRALAAVPAAAARPARERLADRAAALREEQRAAEGRRAELRAEAEALRAARDPEPPAPAWQSGAPQGATPLWRLLDFTDDAGDEPARAGLEAALLASGLLTASLTPDGVLVAAPGELLAGGRGPAVEGSSRAVLRADTDDEALRAGVDDVLARVALGPRAEGFWVDRDGAWGAGPLTGRHAVPASRHVGAGARAAYRAQRLAEVADELATLDLAAAERARRRGVLADDESAVRAAEDAAPRSTALVRRRAQAVAGRRAADERARRARELHARAAEQRTAWLSAARDHRARCERVGLPEDVAGLADVVAAAGLARERCRGLAEALDDVAARTGRADRSTEVLAARAGEREDAERAADAAHGEWAREAAEVATLREHVGAEAAQVLASIRAAEGERRRTRTDLDRARPHLQRVAEQASAAQVQADHAREDATARRGDLSGAAEVLRRRLGTPALVAPLPDLAALLAASLPLGGDADVTAASARRVLGALPSRTADENALVRAQTTLERDVVGNLDVEARLEDGVRLVLVTDATGTRHAAAAAAELVRQRDAGRGALSRQERDVFTRFLLGGVAEELRRRIRQATQLVDAMNASLGGIRTSHGIGVRLRWHLDEPAGSPTARLRELVRTSTAVRPPEETEELVGLIERRVEDAFAADPTAGYAVALRQALDYRSWHAMEVVITGPNPSQERRITRRAKLSQGETRFVSYVTLFAAADAYLSGLPDTARALRLVLLDDAFAKVDDRTIGELMGLLVRLDLDFVMTGHALWGCYPQVPSLDAYEVRRAPGTAAVTTHVHWDGRVRHLRAAR
ncbi:TIGR02680 family protein [Pseudokineococcus basanitobsidens]|uniref:TIGR02680 family protein n=1 Tax=Pseudokineococcus basanitobsidens TaxID=1926649 RepID=A0ABU8RNV5_9ACTN